jgi:hypothetical protein
MSLILAASGLSPVFVVRTEGRLDEWLTPSRPGRSDE